MRSNNTHRSFSTSRSRSRGFAVIEALIAFLVVAFGMMAIGSFQFTLSRASDIAKQRGEATRIAERQLDRLRSFGLRAADNNTGDSLFTFAEEVAVGSSSATETSTLTNTAYGVTTTVSAPTAPVPTQGERFRWIDVAVQWLDRTGATQRIALSSVISDGAPGELGAISTGRSGLPTTLRPKNRNLNIPYPAVNTATCSNGLSGSCSAFIPPPGNTLFVFNNDTGNVVSRCTSNSNSTIVPTENMTFTGLTCTPFSVEAYVLSGYIRFKTGTGSATRLNIANPLGFTVSTADGGATRALIATDPSQAPSATTSPVLITSSSTGYAPSAYECYAQRQLTVRRQSNATAGQTDIRNIPDLGSATVIPSGFTDQAAPRHIAYVCVVTPVDHDSNVSTPGIWSGAVTFNPRGGWIFRTGNNRTLGAPANDSVGAATGDARLCRFTSDYNYNGEISNGEHPLYYRQVTGTLDNQNYLVVDGEDECPGDDRITPEANNPTADDYIDTNAVEHQPAPELSYRCATITGNNTVRCATADRTWLREAALPTTVPLSQIPME